MPASASTVLLLEHVEPRTILEHQLAKRDTTSQVLNSHTVDDKYNDNEMIMIVMYVQKESHVNIQTVIHKMRNTAPEILRCEVITIPIMENSHTGQEEIILMVEMLIITHVEMNLMAINILNLKEAVTEDDLAEVHCEAEDMLVELMAEANLPVRMTVVYQDWDILAIRVFHNTATFVAYVQIKAIMTINAIMHNKS